MKKCLPCAHYPNSMNGKLPWLHISVKRTCLFSLLFCLAGFLCITTGAKAQNVSISGTLSTGNISSTGTISANSTVSAATLSGTLSAGSLNGINTLANLTSIGTISTGVWNGTVVSGQYGGTGVANTGKTITLGGNLITSGNFSITFTAGANSTLTLPASGTLATQAGAEVLTNKTISGASNTLSNISTTSLTGALQAAQFPAITGDVTVTAGTLASTIANNAVSNAKFRQSAASSLVGNATGSPANVTDISIGSGLAFNGATLDAVGTLIGVQVLQNPTTSYTPTTGTTKISMYVIGPGGGGGGGTAQAGAAGGGAGGVAFVPFLTLSGSAPYTCAIGTGGTGNGSNGSGATSITIGATTYTGNAGSGGATGTAGNNIYATGGNGGTATGGTINFAGGAGGYGGRVASNAVLRGGMGGSNMWGQGGTMILSGNTNTAGRNATGFGGGGGGATGSGAAGNGANGAIIIYEYK